MFHCKRQQYVSKAVGMPDHTLEKAVLSFKAHAPKMNKRAKIPDQLRIVLQKMMLWNKTLLRKGLQESMPMLRNLAVKEANS